MVVVVAEVTVKFSSFVASPGSGQPCRLRLPTSPAPSLSTLHEQREGRREGELQCNPRKGTMMVWQAEEEED